MVKKRHLYTNVIKIKHNSFWIYKFTEQNTNLIKMLSKYYSINFKIDDATTPRIKYQWMRLHNNYKRPCITTRHV